MNSYPYRPYFRVLHMPTVWPPSEKFHKEGGGRRFKFVMQRQAKLNKNEIVHNVKSQKCSNCKDHKLLV